MKKDHFSTILIVWSLAIIIILKFILIIGPVPTSSMENTIPAGSMVICTRYNVKDIERYDIMRFAAPDNPDVDYIKRVIGLPGETIVIKDGQVYADEKKLDDSFTAEKMNALGEGVYTVPENCYFMTGDNRNSSRDSRFWKKKYVPEDLFRGKTICLFYKGRLTTIEHHND